MTRRSKALILLFVFTLFGCSDSNDSNDDRSVGVVNLVIEGKSGIDRISGIEIQKYSTVLDVMITANKEGLLTFDYSGDKKTAFVMAINSIANEGANRRNWLLYVNDACATSGMGAQKLSPGDLIQWRFVGPVHNCD